MASKHKIKTETKKLPCRVSEDEVLAFAKEASGLHQDILNKTIKAKAAAKAAKSEIEEDQAEENRLSHIVATGIEDRFVDVDMVADYALCQMQWIRTDTGEVIDSRPLTGSEMQRRLDMDDVARSETTKKRFDGLDFGGDAPADNSK